ncbi:MAG: oligoribonuclease [Polyangiaceae bacterium]|nr:oligoribonuclease [Polyangiaceae bacterium]
MGDSPQRMVWVDLEMTGLNPDVSVIVEIATIVTESDLTVVAEGPSLVIHQPDDVLAAMNDFVRDLHTRSGLLDRIRTSTVSLAEATSQTVAFLERHVPKGTAPLCGNSVWKDRAFLERYMPPVVDHLHYRIVDVSTLKELARRWYPASLLPLKKKEAHRALDDIRESIEELRFYRDRLFVRPPAA